MAGTEGVYRKLGTRAQAEGSDRALGQQADASGFSGCRVSRGADPRQWRSCGECRAPSRAYIPLLCRCTRLRRRDGLRAYPCLSSLAVSSRVAHAAGCSLPVPLFITPCGFCSRGTFDRMAATYTSSILLRLIVRHRRWKGCCLYPILFPLAESALAAHAAGWPPPIPMRITLAAASFAAQAAYTWHAV